MKKNPITQQLLNRHRLSNIVDRQAAIEQWFEADAGRALLKEQQLLINEHLETLFGYHLMQLSAVPGICLYGNSRASHNFALSFKVGQEGEYALVCHETQLPIDTDALDICIVHHLLDFTPSPHELLKEVQRVTRPGGHILVVGFNALGVFGAMSFLGGLSGHKFWNNRLLSARRLADWMTLLDLSVQKVDYGFYRLPMKKRWLQRLSSKVEQILRLRQPALGAGFYIMLTKNEHLTLTPHKPLWAQKRPLVPLSSGNYSPSKNNKTIH